MGLRVNLIADSINSAATGATARDLSVLICEPNAVVAPIHQKAMLVISTKPDEIETWLTAAWAEAKQLQRPLFDDGLVEVHAV